MSTLSEKQTRVLQLIADGWTLAQSRKRNDGYLYRIENDRRVYCDYGTVGEATIRALNNRALIEFAGVELERNEYRITGAGVQVLVGAR